jgi:hypothetical protein
MRIALPLRIDCALSEENTSARLRLFSESLSFQIPRISLAIGRNKVLLLILEDGESDLVLLDLPGTFRLELIAS